MYRRTASLVIMHLTLAACAATTAPRIDTAAEEQAVRAVSMGLLELVKAKDAAGIAALFAEDGIWYREHGDPLVGPTTIQTYFAEDFAANPAMVIDWTTDRVEVAAAGDIAVEHGSWTVSGAGPDGSGSDAGKYITIYRKSDGGWKVSADMGNSTQPAAAQ